jgi:hypothetical protein
MTDDEVLAALLPCPFCGGGGTDVRVTRLSPRMEGPGALIGVTIQHWCQGRNKAAQRTTTQAHGRDHADAIEAWNTRARPALDEITHKVDPVPTVEDAAAAFEDPRR